MPKKTKTRKSAYIPPSHEVVNRKERTQTTRTIKGNGSPSRSGSSRATDPRGFEMSPPSWGRTLKRVPLYFVLIFALQYFMSPPELKDAPFIERAGAAAGLAALVTIAFLPLMHVMERWQYSRWLQRTGRVPAPRKASGDGDDA